MEEESNKTTQNKENRAKKVEEKEKEKKTHRKEQEIHNYDMEEWALATGHRQADREIFSFAPGGGLRFFPGWCSTGSLSRLETSIDCSGA
jgi:hypothetical protein